MRPDKKIITDEVWGDDRVREFLSARSPQGGDHPDFVLLVNAYRGMRVDDFARFIRFYREEQHDLNARNELGQSFVEFIAGHRHGRAFVEVMLTAGATPAEGSET